MNLTVFVEVAFKHVDRLLQVAQLGLVLPENIAIDLLLLDFLFIHDEELLLEDIVVQNVLHGVIEVVFEHHDA